MSDMVPSELLASVITRAPSEADAERLIVYWLEWRGLRATGFRHLVEASAGSNRSVIQRPNPSERQAIPTKFWHRVARADRSDRTRASLMWRHASFAFTWRVDEPTANIAAGEYQDTWEAVLFDRRMAEALVRSIDQPQNETRRRPGRKLGSRRYPGDEALIEQGRKLMAEEGFSALRAAQQLARFAEGQSEEAKVTRLRKAIGDN